MSRGIEMRQPISANASIEAILMTARHREFDLPQRVRRVLLV
jgi:hypothetical protein